MLVFVCEHILPHAPPHIQPTRKSAVSPLFSGAVETAEIHSPHSRIYSDCKGKRTVERDEERERGMDAITRALEHEGQRVRDP